MPLDPSTGHLRLSTESRTPSDRRHCGLHHTGLRTSSNGRSAATHNKEKPMTNSPSTSPRRTIGQLLGLTSALLALQVLNLTVFDDLRTDPLIGVVETFTKPQHLASIIAVFLAVVLVATRHR